MNRTTAPTTLAEVVQAIRRITASTNFQSRECYGVVQEAAAIVEAFAAAQAERAGGLPASEREAFEAEVLKRNTNGATLLRRDPSEPEEYCYANTSAEWQGWQARAALAQPLPAQQAAPDLLPLLTALRFYASGGHYNLDDLEEFDTVSGEPQNWLCSGREDSATMIEDGTIARHALQGKPSDWIDGDDDETPQPIEGEAWQTPSAQQVPAAPELKKQPFFPCAYKCEAWPECACFFQVAEPEPKGVDGLPMSAPRIYADEEPLEPTKPLTRCAADRDGDCVHAECPQLRDNEPRRTGRHCPLDTQNGEDA